MEKMIKHKETILQLNQPLGLRSFWSLCVHYIFFLRCFRYFVFFSVSVYYVWCSCFWVWVAWQLALIHFIGDPNNLKPKQFLFSTCFQNKLSKLLLDIFNILKRVKLTLSQQLCGKNPVTVLSSQREHSDCWLIFLFLEQQRFDTANLLFSKFDFFPLQIKKINQHWLEFITRRLEYGWEKN